MFKFNCVNYDTGTQMFTEGGNYEWAHRHAVMLNKAGYGRYFVALHVPESVDLELLSALHCLETTGNSVALGGL